MTASTVITARLLQAMQHGVDYKYWELRALKALRGIEDQQIRNALVCLHNNGRILKKGPRIRFCYAINPDPPALRADAAKADLQDADQPRRRRRCTTTAGAPIWPVARSQSGFARGPQLRIAA